ncbi:MAG: histidine utilization repressor [Burkholderiaceae bacterium]
MLPQPQYLRLKRFIVEGIASGQWASHERIPSEGELTRQFRVSRMTANRALRELANEGVITRIQGVGSFVSSPKAEATVVEVRDIRREIEARGEVHQSQVVVLEKVAASPQLAALFGIAEGAPLFHSRIVHSADAIPLQLEDRFVNPRLAEDYLTLDLTTITPHEYLMKVAPLERAEHHIEAEMPDASTARLLAVTAREPLLILHRRTWSSGFPASVAKLSYPASRFRLVGHFQLKPGPASPSPA